MRPITSKAPTEVRLFKPGKNPTLHAAGVFHYDPTRAKQLAREHYKNEGRGRLHIDVNHASFGNDTGSIQDNKAYGWFRVEWRPTGIYAVDISWTDEGRALVESRQFRYFSPTFETDEEGNVTVIRGFSLVNNPAKKRLQPLVLSASRTNDMKTKKTKTIEPQKILEEGAEEETVVERSEADTDTSTDSDDAVDLTEEEKDNLIESLKTELAAANDYIVDLEARLDALTDEEDGEEETKSEGEEEKKTERSPAEIIGALVIEGFVHGSAAARLSKLSAEALTVRDRDLRKGKPQLNVERLEPKVEKKTHEPKSDADPRQNRIYQAWTKGGQRQA